MDIDGIRRHCLGLPHATENIQWGYDLVFKIDGKMFAVTPLEVAPVQLSFKCSPEKFAELCELPGVIPAPYMARAQWVALQSLNAIPDAELRLLLEESYRLVWERLPKKRREALGSASDTKASKKAAVTKPKVKAKPAAKAAKSKKGPRR
jgi:predicted DNA-binding protein (MmcQ/YjbR family)